VDAMHASEVVDAMHASEVVDAMDASEVVDAMDASEVVDAMGASRFCGRDGRERGLWTRWARAAAVIPRADDRYVQATEVGRIYSGVFKPD